MSAGRKHGRVFLVGVLLVIGIVHGAVPEYDTAKCSAGLRDFCAPIVRCWTGVEEISCSDVNAYQTLTTAITDEPERDIKIGQSIHMEWAVDFKTSSDGGNYKHPWVSHTNIHAAPAHLGALSPPGKDPLRKDSISFTGGVGTYKGDLNDLPAGEWCALHLH